MSGSAEFAAYRSSAEGRVRQLRAEALAAAKAEIKRVCDRDGLHFESAWHAYAHEPGSDYATKSPDVRAVVRWWENLFGRAFPPCTYAGEWTT